MGMRINHVECLSGELTISEKGKQWLEEADDGPHGFFPESGPSVDHDGRIEMRWSGERSAWAFEDTLAKFLSFTRGTAEFLFYWEGMGVEGVRVVDGKMTKHEVEMKLGKEVK